MPIRLAQVSILSCQLYFFYSFPYSYPRILNNLDQHFCYFNFILLRLFSAGPLGIIHGKLKNMLLGLIYRRYGVLDAKVVGSVKAVEGVVVVHRCGIRGRYP